MLNSGKTLVDFQVLVELSGTNFLLEAKPNGVDIRFRDENGKELAYWIEEWDYSNKKAIIWVKVPRIPAKGETKLLMYYNLLSAHLKTALIVFTSRPNDLCYKSE